MSRIWSSPARPISTVLAMSWTTSSPVTAATMYWTVARGWIRWWATLEAIPTSWTRPPTSWLKVSMRAPTRCWPAPPIRYPTTLKTSPSPAVPISTVPAMRSPIPSPPTTAWTHWLVWVATISTSSTAAAMWCLRMRTKAPIWCSRRPPTRLLRTSKISPWPARQTSMAPATRSITISPVTPVTTSLMVAPVLIRWRAAPATILTSSTTRAMWWPKPPMRVPIWFTPRWLIRWRPTSRIWPWPVRPISTAPATCWTTSFLATSAITGSMAAPAPTRWPVAWATIPMWSKTQATSSPRAWTRALTRSNPASAIR